MLVGPTEKRLRYTSGKTVTKRQLWNKLHKLYRLPAYVPSKVSKAELLNIIQFPNVFFLISREEISMEYVPSRILISDLFELLSSVLLKKEGLLWPFSEPFDIHYLQDSLRIIDMDVFNTVYGVEKAFMNLNIGTKEQILSPSFSSVFPVKSCKSRRYNSEYNSAISDLFTVELKDVKNTVRDPYTSIKKRLSVMVHTATRLYEDISSTPRLVSSYQEKMILKLAAIEMSITKEYRDEFKQVFLDIKCSFNITPLSYIQIYNQIALREGLPSAIMSRTSSKTLLSREEQRLHNNKFSSEYRKFISDIIKQTSAINKIYMFGSRISFNSLLKDDFEEPFFINCPDVVLEKFLRTLLFVFLLLSHLIERQEDVSVKILLNIYRYGICFQTTEAEYSMAYEAVSIFMIEGVKNLRIPLSFNRVLYGCWYTRVIEAYLLAMQNTAKMRLVKDTNVQDCDRLAAYGKMAYTVKCLITLQAIHTQYFKDLTLFGKEDLVKKFVMCFPQPDSHKCNHKDILDLLIECMSGAYPKESVDILKSKATIYDVETILICIKTDKKLKDSVRLGTHLSLVIDTRKSWLSTLESVIKPSAEMKYVLSQHAPNIALRNYISTNSDAAKLYLQQFITLIACCEALIIQDSNNSFIYKAIMTFAKESSESNFYFSTLRELSFMVESHFLEDFETCLHFKEYFVALKNRQSILDVKQFNLLVKKKNYIHLLPDVFYRIIQNADLKQCVDTLLKLESTDVHDVRANLIWGLKKFCLDQGIDTAKICLFDISMIHKQTEQKTEDLKVTMLNYGIPYYFIEKIITHIMLTHPSRQENAPGGQKVNGTAT